MKVKKFLVAIAVFAVVLVGGIVSLDLKSSLASTLVFADQLISVGFTDLQAKFVAANIGTQDTSGNSIRPVATGKHGYTKVGSTTVQDITSTGVAVTGVLGVSGAATLSAGVRYPAALFETVAAGTSAQGDGALAAGKFIHLVTGFDETKVATLPACAAANIGEIHWILNNTTNKFAKIFPASGGTINSLSLDAAYTQGVTGNGGRQVFCFCQAANQWYCS